MENILICYNKCSTCKKAKKWLNDNNVKFLERSIIEDVPNKEQLYNWIKQSGLDIKKFFNTSGLKYKELNLKEKLSNMSDDEKIKLLSMDGKLIKRPLFVNNEIVLVGFKEKEWEEKLINNIK